MGAAQSTGPADFTATSSGQMVLFDVKSDYFLIFQSDTGPGENLLFVTDRDQKTQPWVKKLSSQYDTLSFLDDGRLIVLIEPSKGFEPGNFQPISQNDAGTNKPYTLNLEGKNVVIRDKDKKVVWTSDPGWTPPPPSSTSNTKAGSTDTKTILMNMGDHISSPSGAYHWSLQANDGNLVLYNDSKAVWSPQTGSGSGKDFSVIADKTLGFILYNNKDKSVVKKLSDLQDPWAGPYKLIVADNRTVQLQDKNGYSVWTSPTECKSDDCKKQDAFVRLNNPSNIVMTDKQIISSSNGDYSIQFIGGRLVGKHTWDDNPFFNTDTPDSGSEPFRLSATIMDGLWVIDATNARKSLGVLKDGVKPPFSFVLQPDQNFVLYDSSTPLKKAAWSSGTVCNSDDCKKPKPAPPAGKPVSGANHGTTGPPPGGNTQGEPGPDHSGSSDKIPGAPNDPKADPSSSSSSSTPSASTPGASQSTTPSPSLSSKILTPLNIGIGVGVVFFLLLVIIIIKKRRSSETVADSELVQ
jgi:hypothetical protein